MATASTGWSCVHSTSITEETNEYMRIKVTCYWKNEGWNYNINYVSAWVYCGSNSYKVKNSGSINTTSDNYGKYSMGSYTFTIAKTTSKKSMSCYAKIKSESSYVSGTKSSSATTVTVPTVPSYKVKYNANGGSGAPGSQTKWYGTNVDISSTKPTRTGYTFVGWGLNSSDTTIDYVPGEPYSKNASITLYAIWKINTYTVKYNANGGSGAPGSQTKTYGKTLTLSSTKPTRTGYTFQGWGTSSSDTSVDYAAGASYTANAAITLYAIWKINTWTVSYNANGGSGAPASQTKTYGKTLTLSSTKPTRTNYNFKGWATSASGSVVYAAGGSYTANAAVTLYAVWELAYTKPKITNFKAYRCNSSGTADEAGIYIKVTFNWSTDYTPKSIYIEWTTDTTWSDYTIYDITSSASGTSGSVNQIVGDGKISIENSYYVRIWVYDGTSGTNTNIATVGSAKFPIDIRAKGTGVAIGKVAETDNVFDIGYDNTYLSHLNFLGGLNSQYEKSICFWNPDNSTYHHKSHFYGGNANSPVAIGLWDGRYSERIWVYNDSDREFEIGNTNTKVRFGSAGLYSDNSAGIRFDAYGNIYTQQTMTSGYWGIQNGNNVPLKVNWGDNTVQVYNSLKIPKNGSAGYGLCNADGTSIIRDHNNKNVTVDATGGTLFLGYQNTPNGIDIMNGKAYFDSDGDLNTQIILPRINEGWNFGIDSRRYLKAFIGSGGIDNKGSYYAYQLGANIITQDSSNAYFGNASSTTGKTISLRGNTVRLYAHTSGAVYLGTSGSTAITSDENLKDIYEIDDKYVDFFNNLKPINYVYKNNGHRKHFGFGARQVEEALIKAGLTTEDFAGILKDKDITICADENGTDEDIHYDELYSLRYEEFITLNTMMIQKQAKEISELKEMILKQQEEIEYLKSKIG